jgi:uncharacterized protein
MKCPVCTDAILFMSERQGVEIDYCPTCRGIWLDRGERDNQIRLSAGQQAQTEVVERSPDDHRRREKYYSDSCKYDHVGGDRKKSWLGEIFDYMLMSKPAKWLSPPSIRCRRDGPDGPRADFKHWAERATIRTHRHT